jgi:hypothetical protein
MVLRLCCSLFLALKVTCIKSDEVAVKNDKKNDLKKVIMTYMEKPSTLKKNYKKTMQIFRIVDNLTKTYFNNQLNAQILLFYNNMYVTLQSSTRFEH